MSVYGLYRTGPADLPSIEMIASSKEAAKVMRAMFGPAWHARKLTEAEVLHPWVQSEIAALQEAGVWS